METCTFTHDSQPDGLQRLAMSFRDEKLVAIALSCKLVSLETGASDSFAGRAVKVSYSCENARFVDSTGRLHFPAWFRVLSEPMEAGEYHFYQGKSSGKMSRRFFGTFVENILSMPYNTLIFRLNIPTSTKIEGSLDDGPHSFAFDLDTLRPKLERDLAMHHNPALAALARAF